MTTPASLPKTNNDSSRLETAVAGSADNSAISATHPSNSTPPIRQRNVGPARQEGTAVSGPRRTAVTISKEEVILLIRQLTEGNGRIPTRGEFHQATGLRWRSLRRLFGSYRGLLQEAGFEARGPGWELSTAQLFTDWARVVRELGRVPTQEEYGKLSQYSVRPIATRFKSWYTVPLRMLEFAEATSAGSEWQDVLNIIKEYVQKRRAAVPTFEPARGWMSEPGVFRGQPVYGRPILTSALATAPTNEMGVVFLFGMLAERLGFMVLRLQSDFPDCEALRRMEGEQWQRVRIEFEFESKNFLMHEHDERHCELIVCWRHNWEGCPLEVLELEKVVAQMG